MAKNKTQEKTKTTENTPETAKNDLINTNIPDFDGSDVVDNLENTCFEIASEYINALDDPAEIRENNGLFVDMLKYIYKQYLGYVIGNANNTYIHYDYGLLDRIFNIYTSLVYKYKQNKRCSILEFTIFVHVDRQTLYNAIHCQTKKLSASEVDMVKRWFCECENTLTNGNGVFEIFLLKSQYRYNDNMAPLPVESQGPAMAVNELPDLSTCQIATSEKPDNG